MSLRRILLSTPLTLLTVSVVGLGLTGPAQAASASTVTSLADPDTVVAASGGYVTYGTSIGAQTGGCDTAAATVPYLVHGSGENPGMADCISGDAMPDGPGVWAEGAVWAPGVARVGERFVMYYTASRAGTGQKCIGLAWSDAATGPFTDGREWACPPEGRWAIDANPFVVDGQLHVAYRDDAVAAGAETGLSVVRADADGVADWDTRRTLLLSTDIGWDTRGTAGGTNVVENPSLFRAEDGQWYVAYSGNNFDSDRYATGIAACGASPLPANRCTPIADGVERPYFGFTGATGLDPVRGLPGDHAGPGGMDVFETPSGDHRVVWHWWTGSDRRVMTGDLAQGGDGGFTVT